MCGLFGVMGTLAGDEFKTIANLAVVSMLRGTDSTGVATRSHWEDEGEISVVKQPVHAMDFMEYQKAVRAIRDADELCIGHTRSATVGAINKANAQPFLFDNVCGTHNGTLSYNSKNKLEGPRIQYPTDSMALYARMNDEGLKATLGLMDKDDAMALVWYDRQDHTLHFYRNDKRPLHYTYDKDRKRMYWASRAEALYLVLNSDKVEFDKIRQWPEEVHGVFHLPTKKGEKLDKPETAVLKLPTPFVAKQTKNPNQQATDDLLSKYQPVGVPTSASTQTGSTAVTVVQFPKQMNSTTKFPSESCGVPKMVAMGSADKFDAKKFLPTRMTVRLPQNGGSYYRSDKTTRDYDREKFDQLMSQGCSACGQVPYWGEPVKFLQGDEIMCAPCLSEAQAAEKNNTEQHGALEIVKMFG